jgi:hypothetical protein
VLPRFNSRLSASMPMCGHIIDPGRVGFQAQPSTTPEFAWNARLRNRIRLPEHPTGPPRLPRPAIGGRLAGSSHTWRIGP